MNETNADAVLISPLEHDSVSALPQIPAHISISCCIALSVLYVASLYMWPSKHNRDHPTTVKRRFCSVFVVMLIAPIPLYLFSAPELLERVPFNELLGLRWKGFLLAVVVPYLLTMLLFLGPLCVQIQDGTLKMFLKWDFWKSSFSNILWLRNHVVAPLSEEFVFRACMMPLILQSLPQMPAVFFTPIFFSVAHIHHIVERLSIGMELKTAMLVAAFQMMYTALFGFYSSYLFARTGHFVAPFLVHAFCNHMGFPDLEELWQQPLVRRIVLISCYIVGFVGWIFLLRIATEPALYSNTLFWNV